MAAVSRYVASFDSGSAMVRALAAFLHGKDFPSLGQRGLRAMAPLLAIANRLPVAQRRWLYTRGSGREAIDPELLASIRAEDLAQGVVDVYPPGPYRAVFIGSASGALIHLAAVIRAPWLPQTLLIPVRHGGLRVDDPADHLQFGERVAPRLLRNNGDIILHQMHDPNQDRLTGSALEYFRFKWLALPRAYAAFIRRVLAPGGTIIVAECGETWPTVTVAERHVFQFGAIGGLTAREYREGGAAVAAYLQRMGVNADRWDPPPTDGFSPEAEWGFERELGDDVAAFSRANGYLLRRLRFDDIESLSPGVADLYRAWYQRRGIPPVRLLVGCFAFIEPWWTLRTASVPFWLVFNTSRSANSLKRYLDASGQWPFIDLTLFAHGVPSAGVVPIDSWRELLGRATMQGTFRGVDERAFPADLAVLTRYHDAIRQIPARYPMPSRLRPEDALSALAARPQGEGLRLD